jgi:hypothetical protein
MPLLLHMCRLHGANDTALDVQWSKVYDQFPSLANLTWYGVLGNHDYVRERALLHILRALIMKKQQHVHHVACQQHQQQQQGRWKVRKYPPAALLPYPCPLPPPTHLTEQVLRKRAAEA